MAPSFSLLACSPGWTHSVFHISIVSVCWFLDFNSNTNLLYSRLVYSTTLLSIFSYPTGISNWTQLQWNSWIYPPDWSLPCHLPCLCPLGERRCASPCDRDETLGIMLDFSHLLPNLSSTHNTCHLFHRRTCLRLPDSCRYHPGMQAQGTSLPCLSFCNTT